jgi:hypothetical protein
MVYFIPKIPIWVYFRGPWDGNVGIFYDHLEYFTAIWYSIRQSGFVCGHLVWCFHFGRYVVDQKKSGNTDFDNVYFAHKCYALKQKANWSTAFKCLEQVTVTFVMVPKINVL